MLIYLYVKKHNKTGLKYFGKTTKNDPYRYNGSGTYWKRHLNVHGKDISTLEVWKFDNIDECVKFALDFSEKNNIVESKDWANLNIENGRDGVSVGSPGMKGKDNPAYGRVKELNPFYKQKHAPETIALYKKIQADGGNGNAKKITVFDRRFSTLKEAGKALKLHPETVSRRCNKNKNGYKWG